MSRTLCKWGTNSEGRDPYGGHHGHDTPNAMNETRVQVQLAIPEWMK
jgi:hypothetical protein